MGKVLIRPACEDDASSLAALSIEVWLGTYLKCGINAFFADFALEEFTKPKMQALLADPREIFLVSENEDGIDGFIRLSFDSPAPVTHAADVEVSTLYVQKRHQGRGLGTQLLNAAFAYCRARGVDAVWLATNAENAPAIAFYLSLGFKKIGHTDFRIADQAYLNNVYAKDFGPAD